MREDKMSKKTLRDHLVGFYGAKSLAPEAEARLRRLAEVDLVPVQAISSMPVANHRPRIWYGLAACAAIVILGLGYQLNQAGNSPGPMVASSQSGGLEGASKSPLIDASLQPTLVAVKLHADWCARSPTVAPIFAQLTEKYKNQPVLFVTLDVTDDTRRRQARYLASTLGIEAVFNKPYETGMLKLIDRQRGEVLAIVTDSEQVPLLEGALAQALPRRR
jgi:thiol-disulfide isomerase/thioredoxin